MSGLAFWGTDKPAFEKIMFGIGLPELILIMALALIVVGPDKLPGLAKTVAKQVLELKKAANSLKDSLQDELAEEKESLKELTHGLEDVDASLTNLVSANRDNGAEIIPPGADGEAEGGGKAEDSAPVGNDQSVVEQSDADEAAPKT